MPLNHHKITQNFHLEWETWESPLFLWPFSRHNQRVSIFYGQKHSKQTRSFLPRDFSSSSWLDMLQAPPDLGHLSVPKELTSWDILRYLEISWDILRYFEIRKTLTIKLFPGHITWGYRNSQVLVLTDLELCYWPWTQISSALLGPWAVVSNRQFDGEHRFWTLMMFKI